MRIALLFLKWLRERKQRVIAIRGPVGHDVEIQYIPKQSRHIHMPNIKYTGVCGCGMWFLGTAKRHVKDLYQNHINEHTEQKEPNHEDA